eukprot:TRINITY_DN15511_c0_g2_i1.p1 TRINITY_DN15511_c0_g2~~TRINITY_DN15511_c0_g2_i1.p1  ORF type:complete len:110 (+),score=27.44 TRINITY_DN15511_c0_g2_i1:39-368(+)
MKKIFNSKKIKINNKYFGSKKNIFGYFKSYTTSSRYENIVTKLNERDYLYTFGAGDSGQGGSGTLKNNYEPREIYFSQEVRKIKAVTCNWVNSAIIDQREKKKLNEKNI